MSCTPQEIEAKRLMALQRFTFKQKAASSFPSKSKFQPQTKPYVKPLEQPKRVSTSLFYPSQKVVIAKCSLISLDRFVIEMEDYNEAAINLFKIFPTKHYNPKTRMWDFSMVYYNHIISKLKALKPTVVVEPLPKFVLHFIETTKNEENFYHMQQVMDLNRIDPELRNSLMAFQEEGVRFGIRHGGRCLIADDMGLGKTFQALAIAHYYHDDWPLLIVTTSSMKNVWVDTIHNYLPSVPMMVVQFVQSSKDYIGDSKVLIVSTELMVRCKEKLMEHQFGVLIFDESHILKNQKSKCTQVALELAKSAQRCILLSGTPALSRPCELYTQLSLIDNTLFGSYFQFSKRYCDGKTTQFGWDASGQSHLQELEIIMQKKFMIRRTKEDVLKTLPNKIQQMVKLNVRVSDFSEEDRKLLESLSEKYNNERSNRNKVAILLTYFQESVKVKIPAVCSYILQLLAQPTDRRHKPDAIVQTLDTSQEELPVGGTHLDEDNKFIVFAHHQKMMDAICDVLSGKGVDFIRIDGSTTSEQRRYFVDRFQNKEQCRVAVLSIMAAYAGLTLTRARLVVFAELHWNPSILSQAEARAHRIGQTSSVIVQYLMAESTSDYCMWDLLKKKQKTLTEVGLTKETLETVETIDANSIVAPHLDDEKDILTCANTLDITSYFINSPVSIKTPQKCVGEESKAALSNTPPTSCTLFGDDILNDGCDDIFDSIDI